MSVSDAPTYASELFGATSDSRAVAYPSETVSNVTTLKPPTVVVRGVVASGNEEGEITFTFKNLISVLGGEVDGAQFSETIGADALSIRATRPLNSITNALGNAKAEVNVSVISGGGEGDSSVTFSVATTNSGSIAATDELRLTVPAFENLSGLGSPLVNNVVVSASTRRATGRSDATNKFPTGDVTMFEKWTGAVDGNEDGNLDDLTGDDATDSLGAYSECDGDPCRVVVRDANAVTLAFNDADADKAGIQAATRTGDGSTRIQIDSRKMLVPNSWGDYFRGNEGPYDSNTRAVKGQGFAAPLGDLTLTVTNKAGGADILQWDGKPVDNDLAGVLDVTVTGEFNEGDMAFVNFNEPADYRWDGHDKRMIDGGEALTLNADMTSFSFSGGGLSIDPDDASLRHIAVYYIPAGKEELAHGSKIKMAAMVNYTPSTAADEGVKKSTTELRYHGVAGAIQAYAIPFEGNGRGDKANVRIRCESGDAFSDGKECRAFLECWDDMGMRNLGEVTPAIAAKSTDVVQTGEIETVIGVADPATRYSCRVLATGDASVQVLVNSGGTLVNNTAVNN